ncbi:hemicentin-2-like [Lutzomyia longipalpis]|uniref:hemicentin-2-like n=1 Tax=Lutzomyia longipalpis TaxID=7200 RepID=UPI002483B1A7|nr:hemicentin-2-like [Lutzomyia longipalpis]
MNFLQLLLIIVGVVASVAVARHQVTHVRGDNRRNEVIVWCYVTAKPPMKLSWKSGDHKILSVNVKVGQLPMESEWNIVESGKLYPQRDFVRQPGKFYGMLKRRKDDFAFALVIPTAAPGLRKSGNFICEVGNSPPVSNGTLSVGFEPALIRERLLKSNNSENFILEGHPFELNCPFDGDPQPQVSWKIPKSASSGVKYEENGQRLKISAMKRSFSGDYECFVKNIHGKAKMRFSLKLGESPKLLDSSKYDRVLESFVQYLVVPIDKRITLQCPVSGKPEPKICWYRRDSKRLKATSASIKIRAPKNRNSTFFSCMAWNEFGQMEKMFYIFREGKIPIFRRADVKRNISAYVGEEIQLDCSTYGIPVPEIKWFKDERVLMERKDILRIPSVQRSNSGEYKCKGGNQYGVFTRIFHVTVKNK